MPTLDESLPRGRDRPGRALRPARARGRRASTASRRCVAVALARSIALKKLAPALDGLAEAGLLDAAAWPRPTPPRSPRRSGRPGYRCRPDRSARCAGWRGGSSSGIRARPRRSATRTSQPSRSARSWLALNGVGPATADALLLFALRRPVYPLDRATYRILVRHGWLDPSADYDEARAVVERPAPATRTRWPGSRCGSSGSAASSAASGVARVRPLPAPTLLA